jgi:hypothetical protein
MAMEPKKSSDLDLGDLLQVQLKNMRMTVGQKTVMLSNSTLEGIVAGTEMRRC